MPTPSIAFIGAGRMATALARGFVHAGLYDPQAISASDASPAALAAFGEAVPGAALHEENRDATKQAPTLVLAVKPQFMESVLEELRSAIEPEQLVISIAAGVTLRTLAEGLKSGTRIIRVMPNTPCLIGRGASAFSLGEHATIDDAQTASELLGAVGAAHEVPETLLDAVTGLSGSGPAFVYTVIEAMTDAGVRAGLPRPIAADLANRTVAGAAEMVIETGEHPAVLRDAVTSPGGTTAAGLSAAEAFGLRQAIGGAIDAATQKSRELGRNSEG